MNSNLLDGNKHFIYDAGNSKPLLAWADSDYSAEALVRKYMQDCIQNVLMFWFGPIEGDWPVEDRNAFWWEADEEIDTEIREVYGPLLEQASQGALLSWKNSPQGRLAQILLLDQFTRNIHRRTKEVFVNDATALQLCLEGISQQQDQQLRLVERVFFYMPLMHSEDITHHDKAVELYQSIVDSAQDKHKSQAQRYMDAENLHRDIIVRFGRYPHRNQLLDRESSENELAYLNDQPETFGQG